MGGESSIQAKSPFFALAELGLDQDDLALGQEGLILLDLHIIEAGVSSTHV